MAETILEALQLGRERLLDRGWCKGALADSQGRVCANGALWDAKYRQGDMLSPFSDGVTMGDTSPVATLASEFLSSIVREKKLTFQLGDIEFTIPDIVSFNNHADTKFNDVLALFDEGIQQAKEQGV